MNVEVRVAQLAATVLAGFVAPRLAKASWKLVTGQEPPSQEAGSRLRSILVFAALSGVAVASMQYAANQVTQKVLPHSFAQVEK